MAHFLQYAPHSDFEDGIFVPFATRLEAERQAANDLLSIDPDFIVQIFEADAPALPKFGWTRSQLAQGHPVMAHMDVAMRGKKMTRSQIVKAAKKHQRILAEEQSIAEADRILAYHKAVQDGSAFTAQQPGEAYTVVTGGTATGGAVALAAATAKTVVGIAAGASTPPTLTEVGVSFDGVSASAVPVLVEFVMGTNASNPPGTNSTTQTLKQNRQWPATAAITTAAYTWTSEPTVLEVVKKWLITPNGGNFVMQHPLGREPSGLITASTQGKFIGLRLTAAAIVNIHAYLEVEE